jgi:hypothetical protein
MTFISKRLDANAGNANTFTLVDTFMATDTQCNIYITNRNTVAGNFRLAISAGTVMETNSILYDFPLAARGTFILTDVLVKADEGIYLYSPSNFSIRVEGKEIP